MKSYTPRVVDSELDVLMPELPAIALEGAKGVGKTATGSRRSQTLVQLDDPAQQAVARADMGQILGRPGPLLLDEWQHVPAVWDGVRRAVDQDHRPG